MKFLNLYNLLILSLERLLVNQWVILKDRHQKEKIRKKSNKKIQKSKSKKKKKKKKRKRRKITNG
jgi:hypothetical protein